MVRSWLDSVFILRLCLVSKVASVVILLWERVTVLEVAIQRLCSCSILLAISCRVVLSLLGEPSHIILLRARWCIRGRVRVSILPARKLVRALVTRLVCFDACRNGSRAWSVACVHRRIAGRGRPLATPVLRSCYL